MKSIEQMLNKVGKYLKIDANYFAKSGGYITANHFIDGFARLILSIVLARGLSQIVYGQYNFVLSVLGTLAFLSVQGTTTSIIRSVAKGFDNSLIAGTKDKIKFSILGSIGLFIVAAYMYIRGDDLLGHAFVVCGLFFIPYYALVGSESFLVDKRMFKQLAVYRSLTSIFAVLATVITIYFTRDLFWIIAALIGSTALLNVIFYLKTLKFRQNDKIDNDVIRYGRYLTWVGLTTAVFINIDKLVITYFLGFKDLAIYSIAMVLPRQFKLITKSAVSIIFPGLATLNKEDAHKVLRKRFKQMLLISVVLSIIGALLTPFAIRIIYGDTYTGSILYAQLVFAFMWLVIPTVPISEGLLPAQRRGRRMLKLYLYTYAIYAILLVLLVPRYGIMGAVVSYILDRFFIFVYLMGSLKNIED